MFPHPSPLPSLVVTEPLTGTRTSCSCERRYLGFRKTVLLDRRRIVELVDEYRNGTLSWTDFSSAVMASHTSRMGEPSRRQTVPDRPKEEDYFYANPHECLHQPEDVSAL